MRSEAAWLIEHPNDPRYGRESWYAGKEGFTIDSLQAVRYARKEDAAREIDRFPISLAKNLRAEEHAWIPAPPAEEAVKTDGSMKNILHQWVTPWGHVRLVDGPRPAGMGMELLNSERGEWGPCAPMELMFTKEILRLLCEARRLAALYDGERKLEAEVERLRGLLKDAVDMGDKGSRLIEYCHHHVECATQCWSGEEPFPACDCGASGAVRAFENARAEFGEIGGEGNG